MYKSLSLIFLSIFLTSCTSKNSAFEYFENTSINTQIIQFTKKDDILIDGQPNVLFWGTYLNKLEKYKDLDAESFLVSTYFTKSKTQDLFSNGYDLFLNDKKNIATEEITNNDMYKDLFIKNQWTKKYIVKFKKENDSVSKLTLKLTNSDTKAQLEFEK